MQCVSIWSNLCGVWDHRQVATSSGNDFQPLLRCNVTLCGTFRLCRRYYCNSVAANQAPAPCAPWRYNASQRLTLLLCGMDRLVGQCYVWESKNTKFGLPLPQLPFVGISKVRLFTGEQNKPGGRGFKRAIFLCLLAHRYGFWKRAKLFHSMPSILFE